MEQDWNVRKANGDLVDERTRMRFRVRFGFNYDWSKNIRFGARLRSGVPQDQQSPHWTFGNEFEVYSFKIDKGFIQGKHRLMWWWLGKNSYPFWKQNELFWDDDVNPEGLSFGTILGWNSLTFKPVAGIYTTKSKGSLFSDDGIFSAGQLAIVKAFKSSKLTLATGLFHFKNLADLNQKPLDEELNYSIWQNGVQVILHRTKPISVGFDLAYNLEDYEDNTWIKESALEDQRLAWVFSLSLGKLAAKGDYQIGYRYAHIEKYAVVDYFAQDDWVRWSFPSGTAGTRSSNFKGHEFHAAYTFGKGFNLVTRLFLVKGIKRSNPSDSNLESANRFRIDLNIGF